MLCYITAFFGVIYLLFGGGIYLIPALLGVGGFGVANERRWGYALASVLAVLNVITGFALMAAAGFALGGMLTLLFAIVLAALLLHPQSREYQRIWFR